VDEFMEKQLRAGNDCETKREGEIAKEHG